MITHMTPALRARALRGFHDHLVALGRSPQTIHARTYWAARALDGMDAGPWDYGRAQLDQWMGAGHGWSPATVRQVLLGVRQFTAWAQAAGHRGDDPTVGMSAPRQPDYRSRPIPDDTFTCALGRAHGDDYWLLRVLATTGLRRSEAAALHSDDLVDGFLVVRGKGGRERRIPVQPDVSRWITSRHGWCWPSPNGGHIAPQTLYCRVVRLTGYPPHRLRHRFANRVYSGSHDVRAVQALLGHASLATTQRYLGLTDDQLTRAAAWAA